MPTNILRARSRPAAAPARAAGRSGQTREVLIRAGRVRLRARLLDTPTADRIWRALPLYSTAEVGGEEMFFETPVESGRERGAKVLVRPGEIAFAPDRDVVAIAYGRTPVSRGGETRLWSPSNIWAEALDDVGRLAAVPPGEKVEVIALEPEMDDGEGA